MNALVVCICWKSYDLILNIYDRCCIRRWMSVKRDGCMISSLQSHPSCLHCPLRHPFFDHIYQMLTPDGESYLRLLFSYAFRQLVCYQAFLPKHFKRNWYIFERLLKMMKEWRLFGNSAPKIFALNCKCLALERWRPHRWGKRIGAT